MASAYAVKGTVPDRDAARLHFPAHKTMYGGKRIAAGDTVFVLTADGGPVARGVVTTATPTPRRPGVERQTPRVGIVVEGIATARRSLGRQDFKSAADGTPAAELHFKFYRQATDKIAGISAATAAFLDGCF